MMTARRSVRCSTAYTFARRHSGSGSTSDVFTWGPAFLRVNGIPRYYTWIPTACKLDRFPTAYADVLLDAEQGEAQLSLGKLDGERQRRGVTPEPILRCG